VSGLAGAMTTLADAMQQVVDVQLQGALIEARRNLRELQKEREASGKSLMTGLTTFATWVTGGDVDAGIRAMIDREREAADQIVAIQRRLDDVRSGRAGALTGGAEAGGAGAPAGGLAAEAERAAQAQAETERSLLDRLVRLKIEAHEDEHERALALIRQRYDEERRQMEVQGASAEALHRLQLARDQELTNARMEHQRDLFDEAERQAQDWYADQQRHADVEQRLRDEIERQEIENTLTGADRERALLDLERRRRLGEADTDEQRGLIDRLYAIRDQAIQAADEITTRLSAGPGTFGSFRAGASLAVASVAERTARASEQTAENTRRLLEETRRGGWVFG